MPRAYHQLLEDHWERTWSGNYSSSRAAALRPFFPVVDAEDEVLLDWFDNNLNVVEDEAEARTRKKLNYISFWNAVEEMYRNPDIRAVDSDQVALKRGQIFVLNHARDFVNQAVARITRYHPDVNVLPQNNEYTDRLGARLSKRVIDNLFYINEFDNLCREVVEEAKVCGEAFLFIEYDPFKGDKNPDFTPEQPDSVKRIGEVSFEVPPSFFVLQQPAFKWRDVDYIYKLKIRHSDEIAKEHPELDLDEVRKFQTSRKSRLSSSSSWFSHDGWLIQYEFYHRGTQFLDDGYYCRFIPGAVLHRDKLPYSHRELPVARFTDIDDLNTAHGISFFDDLRPPLVLFNRLMNLMYRNLAITAHPKIMVPEGSCNIDSLANGPFVVEYQPPFKPEVVTFNTINGDIFNYTEKMMGQASVISGTFGISRGETVPNARAASILNFYEEQEAEREGPQIAKYNAFIKRVGRLALGTAGDFYSADDDRTIRVIGKQNRYKVKRIDDVAKLSGPYDIMVERTTALAENKQGRIDQIVQLSQIPLSHGKAEEVKPGLFTREQVLRMIEVGDTPAFFEMATAAVEKAESENEDLFEGIQVPAPERWEAHLIHWNVHFQFIQSREFNDTEGLPPEIREQILVHLQVHEMWMYELAKVNLGFAQMLMENSYFPAVFDFGEQPTLVQLVMMHQAPPAPPPGLPLPEEEPPLPPESDPLSGSAPLPEGGLPGEGQNLPLGLSGEGPPLNLPEVLPPLSPTPPVQPIPIVIDVNVNNSGSGDKAIVRFTTNEAGERVAIKETIPEPVMQTATMSTDPATGERMAYINGA